jgi:hypothetical protein
MKTEKKNGKFVLVQTQTEIEAKAIQKNKPDFLADLDKAKTIGEVKIVVKQLILFLYAQ